LVSLFARYAQLLQQVKVTQHSIIFHTLNDDILPFGREGELVSEFRMGNGNQRLRSLAERPAPEFCDAVLGHDMVHVVFPCGDVGSGHQDGCNLTDGSILRGGREGDEAFAAL